MESHKVDLFIATNSKYFPSQLLPQIREQLLSLDDAKAIAIQAQDFKDPTTMLIISVLAGSLGIDRFLIGHTGLGFGKLLTAGGCGVWAIIDWFLIMDATKERNYLKLQEVLQHI